MAYAVGVTQDNNQSEDTEASATQVPHRFGSLRSLGRLVVGLGVVVVVIGVLMAFFGLLQIGDPYSSPLFYFALGLSMSFSGVLCVALGEAIGCFIAIEHNTRRAAIAAERGGDGGDVEAAGREVPKRSG